MSLTMNRVSLKWLLFFAVGLSVGSFAVFSLLSTYQKDDRDADIPGMVKNSLRSFNDIPPSKEKQLRHVQEALRKSELAAKTLKMKANSSHSFNLVTGGTKVEGQGAHLMTSFKNVSLNTNVHVFYYPWYKNERVDGKYTHWNHEVIPDWHKDSPQHSRKRQYQPPGDIGANFYPSLGPYSSHDPKVIDTHMRQMRAMGTGVVCVSWYPPQYEKTSETPVDGLMPALFDAAAKYGLKVTFHIEPFENRSGKSLLDVSKYIIHKYGNHSAFYRTNFKGKRLPVYYVYDSYQIATTSWAEALHPDGQHSLRNTPYDAIFLGLMVDKAHLAHLSSSGFDGFYTYFASNGFSYASTWLNWPTVAADAKRNNLIFVPSIGPGYLDTRVRPWNSKNTRLRLKGKYYRNSFLNALAEQPRFLSITSFNEWHEGTQIEPAIPKKHDGFKYFDYSPHSPDFYLNLTRQFVSEYTKNTSVILHSHERDAF